MTAAQLIVRNRIVRRWRSLLAIAVISGLGFGAFSAALASARRTDSAFERIAAATEAVHVEWAAPFDELQAAADERRELGVPRQWAGFTDLSLALGVEADMFGPVFELAQERSFAESGRIPSAANELLLNEVAAANSGFGVGDTVDMLLATSDFQSAAPFTFTVVGIGLFPVEEGVVDDVRRTPLVVISSDFVAANPNHIVWASSGSYLPAGPITRVEASAIAAEYGWGINGLLAEKQQRVRLALRPAVTSQWMLGGLGLLATVMITTAALLRETELWAAERPTFRSLGLRRRAISIIDFTGLVLVLGVASVVGVATLLALSPLAPTGPVRRLEPDPGVFVDLVAMGAVVGAVAVTGFLTHLLAVRTPKPRAGRGVRNVPVALASAPTGATWRPVTLGAALSAVAIAGAAAAVPFLSSLDALVNEPERYGQEWDAIARNRFGNQTAASIEKLARDHEVASLATLSTGTVTIDGWLSTPAAGYAVVEGDDLLTITDGRSTRSESEVVIGAATADALGVDLGDEIGISDVRADTVSSVGQPPSGLATTATIVGVGLFPAVEAPGSAAPRLDTGLVIPASSWNRLVGFADGPEISLVEPIEGALIDDVIARNPQITNQQSNTTSTEWFVGSRPAEVRSAADARTALAFGLVALTAVVVIIFALALRAMIRGEQRELAVLRALGMRRSGLRSIVVRQGALVFAPSLLIGVPVGVGLGRLLYARLAGSIGVATAPTTPVWAVAAFVAVVAMASAAGVLLAARSACRIAPALTLRER